MIATETEPLADRMEPSNGAATASSVAGGFHYHKCVLEDQHDWLNRLICVETEDTDSYPLSNLTISQKDIHGNTPLHLALMLKRQECAIILINNRASLFEPNGQGWLPLHEAIASGDRAVVESIWNAMMRRLKEYCVRLVRVVVAVLLSSADFQMNIQLKANLLSDTFDAMSAFFPEGCREGTLTFTKIGAKLRIDAEPRLESKKKSWSLIFEGHSLLVLINHDKRYFKLTDSVADLPDILLQKAVDRLFAQEVVHVSDLSTRDCSEVFSKTRQSENRSTSLYQATSSVTQDLVLKLKHRNDHSSDGALVNLTWTEYMGASPGTYSTFRKRGITSRETSFAFRLSVGFNRELQMDPNILQNIADILPPFEVWTETLESVLRKCTSFPTEVQLQTMPGSLFEAYVSKHQSNPVLVDSLFFSLPSDYRQIHASI